MTMEFKSGRAFRMWLLSVDKQTAVEHLFECLRTGGAGNEAWKLLEDIHGDKWSTPPSELSRFLAVTMVKLEHEMKHKGISDGIDKPSEEKSN